MCFFLWCRWCFRKSKISVGKNVSCMVFMCVLLMEATTLYFLSKCIHCCTISSCPLKILPCSPVPHLRNSATCPWLTPPRPALYHSKKGQMTVEFVYQALLIFFNRSFCISVASLFLGFPHVHTELQLIWSSLYGYFFILGDSVLIWI